MKRTSLITLAASLATALAACTTTPNGDSTTTNTGISTVESNLAHTNRRLERALAELDLLKTAAGNARAPATPAAIARLDSSVSTLRGQVDRLTIQVGLEQQVRESQIAILTSSTQLREDLRARYTNAVNRAYLDALPILSAARPADVTPILRTLSTRCDGLAAKYQETAVLIQRYQRASTLAPARIAANPAQFRADTTRWYNIVSDKVNAHGTNKPVSPAAIIAAFAQLRTQHLNHAQQLSVDLERRFALVNRDYDDLASQQDLDYLDLSEQARVSYWDLFTYFDTELANETAARIRAALSARGYTDRRLGQEFQPRDQRTNALDERSRDLERRTGDLEQRTAATPPVGQENPTRPTQPAAPEIRPAQAPQPRPTTTLSSREIELKRAEYQRRVLATNDLFRSGHYDAAQRDFELGLLRDIYLPCLPTETR